EKLLALSKPKLMIVDELGYLPLQPDAAHLFFQLVSRRYEAGAMLITSNRSVAEWGTVFADPVVATAILDRLLHHSHVLTIRGDSFRLRAKRKSGLIRPPASHGAPVGSASLRPVTGGNEHQPDHEPHRWGAVLHDAKGAVPGGRLTSNAECPQCQGDGHVPKHGGLRRRPAQGATAAAGSGLRRAGSCEKEKGRPERGGGPAGSRRGKRDDGGRGLDET